MPDLVHGEIDELLPRRRTVFHGVWALPLRPVVDIGALQHRLAVFDTHLLQQGHGRVKRSARVHPRGRDVRRSVICFSNAKRVPELGKHQGIKGQPVRGVDFFDYAVAERPQVNRDRGALITNASCLPLARFLSWSLCRHGLRQPLLQQFLSKSSGAAHAFAQPNLYTILLQWQGSPLCQYLTRRRQYLPGVVRQFRPGMGAHENRP